MAITHKISDEIMAVLTKNQQTLIDVLQRHEEGLLSSELAHETSISNKSATVTPELKRILADNGYQIVIQRNAKGFEARWTIEPIEEDEPCLEILFLRLQLLEERVQYLESRID